MSHIDKNLLGFLFEPVINCVYVLVPCVLGVFVLVDLYLEGICSDGLDWVFCELHGQPLERAVL